MGSDGKGGPAANAGPRSALRAVGLGLLVVDRVFEVEAFVEGAVRTRYGARLTGPGGMAANAMAQVAALGVRAELLSSVGDDTEGRALLARLRRAGVSTRRVVRSKRFGTSTAVVMVERKTGERRFVIPDRRQLEPAVPDFELGGIGRRSILLVDGHYARQAARAVARARELGAPVVGDFADARPSIRKLLRSVAFPVVPEEFVESFGVGGPRETLRALRRLGAAVPVVTLGAGGALALEGQRFRRIPARRVRVRDTTGAGDAFHGGFVAGLARGLPPLRALDLATRAAAACCRAFGAQGHLGPPGASRGGSKSPGLL